MLVMLLDTCARQVIARAPHTAPSSILGYTDTRLSLPLDPAARAANQEVRASDTFLRKAVDRRGNLPRESSGLGMNPFVFLFYCDILRLADKKDVR